jgi:DNA uptake protein ComE-like DNA-binding protein
MNPIRRYVRDVFGFSGNEINGFLILLPLMAVLIFSEPIYRAWLTTTPRAFEKDQEKLDSLLFQANFRSSPQLSAALPVAVPFNFDPNTAGVGELDSLGIPRSLANRIAAYRQKGGVFRIKSDLLKIYGLDSALYHQLYPYIDLPVRHTFAPQERHGRPPATARAGGGAKFDATTRRRLSHKDTFDINTADTILLKSVYGIGSTLAARIIKFRDALGGFVKPEQLNEVYGLDSLVVKRLLNVSFIGRNFIPAKININSANEEQLSAHPYVTYKIARALVTFRYQHGDFADVNDIKKLSAIGEREIARLLPYIKVRD